MLTEKLSLIHEQTSPLFRIMSVYHHENVQRKSFTNNICAFHIGGGRILTVAHNLRSESGIVNAIDDVLFQNEIGSRLDATHPLHQQYQFDQSSGIRYMISGSNANVVKDTLRQINFDTRWITLYQKKICKPFLIIQFSKDSFYDDPELTGIFNSSSHFHEPSINRYTFIIELELVKTFFSDDIAMYQIINTDERIIRKLPSIEADFGVYDSGSGMFCLQSAPGGFLGRLLNTATIEGFLDHHAIFSDRIGGHYIMEGLRYLIRGYFRFGSSGAPYVYYDGEKFRAAAIQSEASPIQLSINNNREGNYQYVNAIATPLRNIEEQIKQLA